LNIEKISSPRSRGTPTPLSRTLNSHGHIGHEIEHSIGSERDRPVHEDPAHASDRPVSGADRDLDDLWPAALKSTPRMRVNVSSSRKSGASSSRRLPMLASLGTPII
jgi:hypothetical protein